MERDRKTQICCLVKEEEESQKKYFENFNGFLYFDIRSGE